MKEKSNFKPTHRITTDQGSFLVQFEEFENSGGPAYTKAEWDGGDPADYERNHHGVWTLMGQPFRGTVEEVEEFEERVQRGMDVVQRSLNVLFTGGRI